MQTYGGSDAGRQGGRVAGVGREEDVSMQVVREAGRQGGRVADVWRGAGSEAGRGASSLDPASDTRATIAARGFGPGSGVGREVGTRCRGGGRQV